MHFNWCSKLPSNDLLPPCMARRIKRCSRCVLLKKKIQQLTMPCIPFSQFLTYLWFSDIYTLAQDMSLCPLFVLTILLSPKPPPPSFDPHQLILEWLKSERGRWSSCLVLQSCKRIRAARLLFFFSL